MSLKFCAYMKSSLCLILALTVVGSTRQASRFYRELVQETVIFNKVGELEILSYAREKNGVIVYVVSKPQGIEVQLENGRPYSSIDNVRICDYGKKPCFDIRSNPDSRIMFDELVRSSSSFIKRENLPKNEKLLQAYERLIVKVPAPGQ